MKRIIVPIAALTLLAGCASVAAVWAKFEERADPVIQAACAGFRQAQTDPMVRLILSGGTMVVDRVTGGSVGPTIASLWSYGDAFCSNGPPVADTTSPMQQRNWLLNVMQQMLWSAHSRPI